MGYTYRNNGQIKDFWPDDDDNTLYLSCTTRLSVIIEMCQEKWGADVSLEDITIESDQIHTSCLTYDLYSPSDHTDFVIVRKIT